MAKRASRRITVDIDPRMGEMLDALAEKRSTLDRTVTRSDLVRSAIMALFLEAEVSFAKQTS